MQCLPSLSRKRTLSIFLLLILNIASMISISVLPAYAAPEIYMTPSTNPPQPGPYVGFKWNITIWVEGYGIPPVFAWQVRLNYDPAAGINVTRAWNAIFDPNYIFTGRDTVNPLPDIDVGTVLIGDSLLGGSGETSPPEPAMLAIIEFQIIEAKGITPFNIDNADTYLLGDDLSEIPVVKTGGSYTCPTTKPNVAVLRADGQLWPLEFAPSPPPTGQTFDVNVKIENLDVDWGLIQANMTIAFNASVIDIIGGAANLTVNPFWGEFTFEINYNEDPLLDNIVLNVSNPSQTPEGNVLVATIRFTVVYEGPWGIDVISPLDFVENVLVDDPGPALIPQNPPVNGEVVIRGMTIEVRLPPHTPGANQFITNRLETFNVEVWLNDVTADKRLIGVQFRLRYNSTLLYTQNSSITEGSFFTDLKNGAAESDTYFRGYVVSERSIDPSYYDKYGPHIVVFMVLLPNANESLVNFPTGSGVIATITFQGIYRGDYPPEENHCILELVDVILVDDASPVPNTITTTPINGYYQIWSYRLPVATFTYAPPFNATIPVVFDASKSYDFGLGFIVNYTWDFGDGNITTMSTPMVNHTYTMPGTYNVTLTVTDDDDQPNSITKSLTVAKLISTISMDVAPSTVTFGQNITINGTISPRRKGVDVTIQYRLQGETEWQTLTLMTTDSEGKYSYVWTATKNTLSSSEIFEFRASWSGDEITDPAQSDINTLVVNRVRSKITISLDTSTITIGSEVTISGTLTPRRANVNITVLSRLRGETWSTLETIQTDSSGGYTHTWTATAAGTYEIRTTYLGDNNMGPAQSRILTLKVNRVQCTITINVNPTLAIVGSNVTINGTITPTKPEVNVTIHYRRPGEIWKTLAEVKTDSTSNYSYTWEITETGTFEVKVSFSGDADTSPSESNIKTINAEPRPINILLYAISVYLIIIVVTTAIIISHKRKSTRTQIA